MSTTSAVVLLGSRYATHYGMDIHHIAMLHEGSGWAWSLDENSFDGWEHIAKWRPEGPDHAIDCLAEMIGYHLLKIRAADLGVRIRKKEYVWQEELPADARTRFRTWGEEANVGMWVMLAKDGSLKPEQFHHPLFQNIEICESTMVSAQAEKDQGWPWV